MKDLQEKLQFFIKHQMSWRILYCYKLGQFLLVKIFNVLIINMMNPGLENTQRRMSITNKEVPTYTFYSRVEASAIKRGLEKLQTYLIQMVTLSGVLGQLLRYLRPRNPQQQFPSRVKQQQGLSNVSCQHNINIVHRDNIQISFSKANYI